MFSFPKILVLAPHTDDGELGSGGLLARCAARGSQITYAAFSSCAASLPEGLPPDTLIHECRQATAALNIAETMFFDFDVRHFPAQRQQILEELVVLNRQLQPDLVLLPAQGDLHQDHQVLYAEGLRAFRKSSLLGYELPWNNTRFQPNYFEPLEEEDLRAKQACLKHYRSQAHRPYMNDEFLRSLALVRGQQCGQPLAEAFEAYRLVRT